MKVTGLAVLVGANLFLLFSMAFGEPKSSTKQREWPYYAPSDVSPPQVDDASRVRNGIDRFVLARLNERDLGLAPDATPQVLIRRLFHDLIGLPPTPEEVEAFAQDEDPAAFDKLVDRLLKDPRYGERWARLWLDLARYADTAGYEGDPDLPWAWRYRDYVIDAFNNDKPYDLFIMEQIAGDEFTEIMGAGDLPKTDPEHVVALTFLRLAPFTEPRGDETRHEFLSEITSTVSSVFLGLTVGCAQCHDHKYDGIPTKDFYRMKAFFSTVAMERPEPGDSFQIGGPLPAEFYRPGEKEWAAQQRQRYEREASESVTALAELKAELQKELGGGAGVAIQSAGGSLGNNYPFTSRPVSDGKLHYCVINSNGRGWSFHIDGTESATSGLLAGNDVGHWFGHLDQPNYLQLGSWTNGTGDYQDVTRVSHHGHFAEVVVYDHPLNRDEQKRLNDYVQSRYEGKGSVAEPPDSGLRFWLDASDLDADPTTPNPAVGSPVSLWKDKVSGVVLRAPNDRLRPSLDVLGATKAPAVLFHDHGLLSKTQHATFLKDKQGALVLIFSATHQREGYGFEIGGNGEFISSAINPSAGKANAIDRLFNDPNSALSKAVRRRYETLRNASRYSKQRLKRLQPLATSLRHSYGPPFEPGVPTTHVLIRGEYDNKGEIVEAGFPSAITGNQAPANIRLDPFKRWPTRSRRMTLAKWIASPENPLTARVMANRLWAWHFGRGLVATPSDFGKLSGGSSHPALLDWLAVEFTKRKWSIKEMHRLMVTSSTYRQSSNHDSADAMVKDAENKLLWKFHRRRLEAEGVRDSILAVSNRLNPESHGLPIFPPLPGDLAETVKYSTSKWDTQYGPEGRKRSIYIYQQRTLSMPMMQVFDSVVCDESRPRRRASVTALQALALYNGDLVNEESMHFAERVRKEAGSEADAQIRRAFQIALARTPTEQERVRMRGFLEDAESDDDALIGLCRILYNLNEFIYID